MRRYESMSVAQLTLLIDKYQNHIDKYPYSYNTDHFRQHVVQLKEVRSSKIGAKHG